MRTKHALLLMSLLVIGCATETGDVSEDTEDELGSAEDAVIASNAVQPNAVQPNAVQPNAVQPNAVQPNALSPSTLDPDSMDALQNDGEAGELSRMHVKYLVICAFTSDQSFSFSWTDSQGNGHDETYVGSLGLAPEWASGPLGTSGQRWVSACMASLTNYYGVSVLISMRGSHSALAMGPTEWINYPRQEGAFWGNIFTSSPYLKACYNSSNANHSRSLNRVCATGLPDGTECGPIDVVGPCSSACANATGIDQHYPSCNGESEVITTYLPN